MTNKDAHVELNEMLYELVKMNKEEKDKGKYNKRQKRIYALVKGCEALREKDQMKLF